MPFEELEVTIFKVQCTVAEEPLDELLLKIHDFVSPLLIYDKDSRIILILQILVKKYIYSEEA